MAAPTKRYHVSTPIDAPADQVWALLTNAESWKEWNPTIIDIVGPIEVGRKVSLKVKINPKRTFKLGVKEMSAPNRMVWADGMPLGLFTGTRTYALDGAGDSCTFSMTEEYTGPLSSLICRSIPDMTESFEAFAAGLKQAAEARS